MSPEGGGIPEKLCDPAVRAYLRGIMQQREDGLDPFAAMCEIYRTLTGQEPHEGEKE